MRTDVSYIHRGKHLLYFCSSLFSPVAAPRMYLAKEMVWLILYVGIRITGGSKLPALNIHDVWQMVQAMACYWAAATWPSWYLVNNHRSPPLSTSTKFGVILRWATENVIMCNISRIILLGRIEWRDWNVREQGEKDTVDKVPCHSALGVP